MNYDDWKLRASPIRKSFTYTKEKKPESYRDLKFSDVIKYADEHGLNSEGENYREAAILLFNEKHKT